ncbi:MAG: hypothetical protein HXX16_05145 [Bacteroidales bacterium]|nr:hypothetical protein [Bacteroidales bacterium]
MKIVSIFTVKLFSFHYPGEKLNELRRLLNCWNDTEYIYNFLKENKSDIQNKTIEELAELIIYDAHEIDISLHKLSKSDSITFESFFKPLDNKEYSLQLLSPQKGRRHCLRIYALKIDANCFVITGGAIKLNHLMEDREHTQKELQKIKKCQQFLKNNSIHDSESFYEFIIEQQ